MKTPGSGHPCADLLHGGEKARADVPPHRLNWVQNAASPPAEYLCDDASRPSLSPPRRALAGLLAVETLEHRLVTV